MTPVKILFNLCARGARQNRDSGPCRWTLSYRSSTIL